MARYTIKEGRHDDTRLFSSWPHIGRTSISRYVIFDDSCRYTLPQYNSLDINKLFGLSFGLFAVHENSARFGWYYEAATDSIALVAYVYRNGQRNWNAQMEFPVVARVKMGQRVYLSIDYTNDPEYGDAIYSFQADVPDQRWREVIVNAPDNLPGYGFTHSVWFGGSLPAPRAMHIDMEPVK